MREKKDGLREDLKEHLKGGFKKGFKNKMNISESVAIRMLENNEPIEKIIMYTQLSESRIHQLKEKLCLSK
ncbi:MAG: hypothetical protein IKO41_10435 [Lachnospiraceae bacterium]|nr:hypothetical protein [Lachnospiraceae bacterium]